MSDRCYVRLTCRRDDIKQFEDLDFFEDDWGVNTHDFLTADMVGEEMNYGATDDLEALAAEGIPFYGHHESGGEYGPMLFASANGESIWVDSCNDMPMAAIERDGTVEATGIHAAMTYYRLQAAADALMEECQVDGNDAPHEA